jgi:hypothetical protein
MDTVYTGAQRRPAPTNERTFRQNTDWTLLSNEQLKFALDVLSLHHSPFEVDAANEIMRRIERDQWLDIDLPVPTIAPSVPAIFYYWPFSLLWSQRPR